MWRHGGSRQACGDCRSHSGRNYVYRDHDRGGGSAIRGGFPTGTGFYFISVGAVGKAGKRQRAVREGFGQRTAGWILADTPDNRSQLYLSDGASQDSAFNTAVSARIRRGAQIFRRRRRIGAIHRHRNRNGGAAYRRAFRTGTGLDIVCIGPIGNIGK